MGEDKSDLPGKVKAAIIKVLIYAAISSPGAFAAFKNQNQATVETVEKVNVATAKHIERLQVWSEWNKETTLRLAETLKELRKEMSQDRRETNRILLQLSSSRTSGRRVLREEIRDRGERPPSPVTKVSQRPKLPTLKRPKKSLKSL